MPEVSRFYGIVIRQYADDHPPAHFHAHYGEFVGQVEVKTGEVLRGDLPTPQLRMVQAWAVIHQEELLQNWERLQQHEPGQRIAPLR